MPNPYPNSTANNVLYRSANGATAIVKLELVGLPIYVPTVTDDMSHSSAIILYFNFTGDGKHLMVNGEVIALQVPNPSVPAIVMAKQVPANYDIGYVAGMSEYSRWAHSPFKTLGIDYEISARNRDDPNIRYYNYGPEIMINIVGCSSPEPASEHGDILLDSLDQKVVKIKMEDYKGSRQSDDPNRAYRIEKISLEDRSAQSGFKPRPKHPESEGYRVPRPDDKPCSMWSWRCEDFGDPPWYQFIWRRNFDEFGRIHCMRWRITRWWSLFAKPVLDYVTPPLWIAVPLTLLALYIKLARPLMQRGALSKDGGKQQQKDW